MSLLFNFRPLVINPELAVRIGLNESIILQQVNYWLVDREQGVDHDGRRWVFNSYEAWVKQFPFWSVDTVKRAFTSLVKQGVMDVEQLNKSQHDRTNFYTINFGSELLKEPSEEMPCSMSANCPDRQEQVAPMDEGKSASSLQVTTTYITTEITKPLGAQAAASTPDKPAKSEYSPEFETAWKAYPARQGSNPKNKAYQSWSARLREGVSVEAMLQGVNRYAAYQQALGKIGTEFVMQGTRFFGTGLEFENAWVVAGTQQAKPQDSKHSGFNERDYGKTSTPVWARGNA